MNSSRRPNMRCASRRSRCGCSSRPSRAGSLGLFGEMIRALTFLILVTMCSCGQKDQAEDALDQARRLASEGKFEEALQKHIWFHNHALEVDPAYYGVRLSFALRDWVELGKKYPAALTALRKIRDEKTSRLVTGQADRNLFHDVESINEYLDESAATVELFKKIEVAQPDFAASVYDLADKALIATGEYALAKRYLGNPITRFETAKRQFEDGMRYAKTSQKDDASRRAFERIFTDRVVRIIRVLDKSGDQDQAREIQSKALVVLDNSTIRNAISR